MEHRDVFTIEDIIMYCDRIESYLERYGNDRKSLNEDTMFENACSFAVFQIGELTNSLSDKFKQNHPEMPWRQIIGMRNLIAHDYGDIDTDTLWETITVRIPELKAFCQSIIS